MTSKELLAEIEKCAAVQGCAFNTGPVHAVNIRLGSTPEIWAEPPVLKKREGVNEGLFTWSVVLRLIAARDQESGYKHTIDKLEQFMSRLCVSLSRCDDIAGLPDMSYSQEEGTLTNRGEISLKGELTIKTRF